MEFLKDTDNETEEDLSAVENFRTAVIGMASTDPTKPLTDTRKSLIDKHIGEFFTHIHNPDHPTYSAMIRRAIEELNEEGGSSVDNISYFIIKEYNDLPWAHFTFLKHHLGKLCESGEIVLTPNNSYLIARPTMEQKPKRGRPRGSKFKLLPVESLNPIMEEEKKQLSEEEEQQLMKTQHNHHEEQQQPVCQAQGWFPQPKPYIATVVEELLASAYELQQEEQKQPSQQGQGNTPKGRGRGRPKKQQEQVEQPERQDLGRPKKQQKQVEQPERRDLGRPKKRQKQDLGRPKKQQKQVEQPERRRLGRPKKQQEQPQRLEVGDLGRPKKQWVQLEQPQPRGRGRPPKKRRGRGRPPKAQTN